MSVEVTFYTPTKERKTFDTSVATDLEIMDFSNLVGTLPNGLCILDESHRILYANIALAHILGYSDTSYLVGIKLSDFLESRYGDTFEQQLLIIHNRADYQLRMAARTSTPGQFGGDRWIEILATEHIGESNKNRYSVAISEISLDEYVEEDANDNSTLCQSIVEMSPESICIASLDGTILNVNQRALQLYACTDKVHVIGMDILNFVVPSERDWVRNELSKIAKDNHTCTLVLRLKRMDDTLFWAEINAKHIPHGKANTNLLLIYSHDISNHKATEQDLRTLLATDELTGLYNRRGFLISAGQELKHAHRIGCGCALLFFDLDNMKKINDAHGHSQGDHALKTVARIMRETFRESDIIARWGGDEFAVLAVDVPQGCVPTLLERFHTAMDNVQHNNDIAYRLSLSVGVAEYNPYDPKTMDALIAIADIHMYEHKQSKGIVKR
jgi:diguanylate cyclase (GGDEF)-like protein/PAS domain S-box-containing protein